MNVDAMRSLYFFALLGLSLARSVHSSKLRINVINLDKDTARWEVLVQRLTASGVPQTAIHRLPAVYGINLSKQDLASKATFKARLFCTPGMIGCYLSHVKFWEKVRSESVPYQLVLEDDAIVSPNFHQRAQQMIDELQDNPKTRDSWDVLLLGAFSCVHPEKRYGVFRGQAFLLGGGRQPRRITSHIHIPHRPLGTHAYILSQRGARKLLQLASRATWHVDCVIWGIRELDLFLCDPMLVFQDAESPSSVGAVTKGLETWLPKWRMDEYTGVSFEWAMNEPFFRIPFLHVTVTIGRYMTQLLLGTVAEIMLMGKIPRWILPTHVGLCIGFAFAFTRIMKRPQGAVVNVDDSPNGTADSLESTTRIQ
jgi:GR25 family glycosyltransferase involved in LPS biosynthesis